MQITYADKDLIKKYNLEPLTRHVTRRITYKLPASAKNFDWPEKVQTVTFHRIASVDPNAADSTDYDYSMWKAEGRPIWPEVVSPKLEGYKASPITIPRVMLDEKSHDEDLEVKYIPVSPEAKEAYKETKKLQIVSSKQNKKSNELSTKQQITEVNNNLFSNLNNFNTKELRKNEKVSSTTKQAATDEDKNRKQIAIQKNNQESTMSNVQPDDISSNESLTLNAQKTVFAPVQDHLPLIPRKIDNKSKKTSKNNIQSSNDEKKIYPKIEKNDKTTTNTNRDEDHGPRILRDYELNFARLEDLHSRPIVLSNEYAHLREDAVVASIIGSLAQTGEIDYVPVRHNWNRVDYDWGGLFE